MEQVQLGDGEYIGGKTSSIHGKPMHFISRLSAAAFLGITCLLAAPNQAQANECFGLYGSELNTCQLTQSKKKAIGTIDVNHNCPEGTRYRKIKAGGLLFKRTVAEGCFTDYQASNLKINAQRAYEARTRNNLNQIQSHHCTTNLVGNSAFTNCI
ncbi:hypothetical protein SynBIOSE41_03754 [Synechococcus sp. BIOS-E4-1]|uniref:hypothetical protein n=1 Tax=Synechococcus sp. BIOS-E4-1 TaxID=1400864 RepID=UPI0016479AEC|nr:hypothetical protein [Synechococcus sp. BIOS-E4-1]QNI56223.1 hypothetical protein SynBIOSE41_03754 [Synechococcus sp. BIOS-E4-1]